MIPTKKHDQLVLANAGEAAEVLTLDNELTVGADGWALLAPFGEHPKERIAVQGGRQVVQRFLQIIDEQAVNDILANEQGAGVFQRIKRALIKRPIFNGHPDLKQHSPETVTADPGAAVPIGLVDGHRKTERGLETRMQLTPAGADVVENGHKFPSGMFRVRLTGEIRDGAVVVRPFELLSVGLTPCPNISGVDSLANAGRSGPDVVEPNQPNTTMKSILIGWLVAQGVVLANDASDQAVLDAFRNYAGTQTSTITTLGNEKSTLTGQITTLTNERDTARTELAALKTAKQTVDTALANERTALAAEHKSRIEDIVDLVITQGRVAVADRATEITALSNSKDFAADTKALRERPVKFTVAAGKTDAKSKEGAATARSATEKVMTLANSDERYKGRAFTPELFGQILKDNPSLEEEIKATR